MTQFKMVGWNFRKTIEIGNKGIVVSARNKTIWREVLKKVEALIEPYSFRRRRRRRRRR